MMLTGMSLLTFVAVPNNRIVGRFRLFLGQLDRKSSDCVEIQIIFGTVGQKINGLCGDSDYF